MLTHSPGQRRERAAPAPAGPVTRGHEKSGGRLKRGRNPLGWHQNAAYDRHHDHRCVGFACVRELQPAHELDYLSRNAPRRYHTTDGGRPVRRGPEHRRGPTNVTLTANVAVPANAVAGTYSSTWSLSMSSGP